MLGCAVRLEVATAWLLTWVSVEWVTRQSTNAPAPVMATEGRATSTMVWVDMAVKVMVRLVVSTAANVVEVMGV